MSRLIPISLLLSLLFFSPSLWAAPRTPKRLPKKIKVPEGYIPVDPTRVQVNDKLYNTAELKLQESLVKDENFQGVIQFVRGEVTWADSSQQPDPQFKSILKKGDALKVGPGSLLKIITHKRCIGVIYGPGEVSTPRSKEDDVWQLSDSSLRWNCPGKSEETLQIGKRPLTLFGSEIFYNNSKLIVIAGEPLAENGSLEEKKIYIGKSTQWRPLKNPPHIHTLWAMNQELTPPKESALWVEPEKPRKYRFSIGPQLGYGPFQYSNSDIQSAIPSDVKGARLTGYFHRDKDVYFLSINSTKRESGPRAASGGSYAYSGRHEIDVLSLGKRFRPESDWSYTTRLGLGSSDLQPQYNNGSSFYSHSVNHTVAQIGLGVDKIFRFQGFEWLGLVISADLQFTQAIGSARFKDGNAPSGDPLYTTLEQNGFSSFEFLLHAAPLIYF